ncbi:unnamed protein product [Caenorhabditis angaria]|uniref:Uncharacterized protein n=1 Tax=Caenorhabditis angaria TaxID=860376 RepID=A0A9P1IA01_9PELO|nr:unnamed protein product [Caenorhabditis angaria]
MSEEKSKPIETENDVVNNQMIDPFIDFECDICHMKEKCLFGDLNISDGREKLQMDTKEVKVENSELGEDNEFNFDFSCDLATRQFQTEEVMLILETYINNINVFKNQTTQTPCGKPMTRKIMIQQIADNCTNLGHGFRTPKQIEQKLRDEFKKLRRFKNELSNGSRKNIGNLLVFPKASQGTIFLYNSLCDPNDKIEVDFESSNTEHKQSVEHDESINDQALANLQSILEATMSHSLTRETSVISPTPSSSREKPSQPPSRKRAHPHPSKPEFTVSKNESITLEQSQQETEKLKQEYYSELIRNEKLYGELLKIRIEKEKNGIKTSPDPCLETENELGAVRRRI